MDKRKEELEKKRQKLAELRKAREERKTSVVTSSSPSPSVNRSSTLVPQASKKDIDDLVASLVGTNTGPDSSASSSASLPQTPAEPETAPMQRAAPVSLSVMESVLIDLPPKPQITYDKEIQTAAAVTTTEETSDNDAKMLAQMEKKLRDKILQEQKQQEELKKKEEQIRAAEHEANFPEQKLTDEEKAKILSSEDFMDFIDSSSKIIERALNEPYDFLKDYTKESSINNSEYEKKARLVNTFFDEKHCRHRVVSDLSWSHKHAELFLSAHGKNAASVNEPDGQLLVWNLHLQTRPEFIFYAQSDITTAMFSPFHANLIVGGTYAGQILLWDTRAKSAPVLKSALSSTGHTHPVYYLDVVGTPNAHHILSASTDGTICSWQMDMLAKPFERLDVVQSGNHVKTDEVSITAFDYPSADSTTLWVGTLEGNVYQVNRQDRAGKKSGLNPNETYVGHAAPITALKFHPSSSISEFNQYFLTASIDWTVKLWKSSLATTATAQHQKLTPIFSFDHANDYVYDVQWSTKHPTVFASVDGVGQLDFWNIAENMEAPSQSIQVTPDGSALSKLSWSHDGQLTVVGSADGHLYLFDVGQLSQWKPDDPLMMQKQLHHLETNLASSSPSSMAQTRQTGNSPAADRLVGH